MTAVLHLALPGSDEVHFLFVGYDHAGKQLPAFGRMAFVAYVAKLGVRDGPAKPASAIVQVTPEQKQELLNLLDDIPRDLPLTADARVRMVSPYLHILFALNEKDVKPNQLAALFNVSLTLHYALPHHRSYGLRNYASIQHPAIKIAWGIMLLESNEESPEVIEYLRASLNDPARLEMARTVPGVDIEPLRKTLAKQPEASK